MRYILCAAMLSVFASPIHQVVFFFFRLNRKQYLWSALMKMQGVPFLFVICICSHGNKPIVAKERVGCLISSPAQKPFYYCPWTLRLHIAEALILHNYCHDSRDSGWMSGEVECRVCDGLKGADGFFSWVADLLFLLTLCATCRHFFARKLTGWMKSSKDLNQLSHSTL